MYFNINTWCYRMPNDSHIVKFASTIKSIMSVSKIVIHLYIMAGKKLYAGSEDIFGRKEMAGKESLLNSIFWRENEISLKEDV